MSKFTLTEKINNISNKKLWLAPLAGYTDRFFRKIAKNNGADVLVSEMVSADGLIYNFKKTKKYIIYDLIEKPYGIQLFGDNPDIMKKAAELVMQFDPDFIDINMGCPVKKVVNRNSGSALMRNIVLAQNIVYKVKEVTTRYNIPLSVKFRSGWDNDSLNALEFSLAIQEAGADILIVHPRTKSQMFSGLSDWDVIKQVKNYAKIPVIGNGDIISKEKAQLIYDQTGCDSIMIGRGALGKPWLFNEIIASQKNSEFKISSQDKLRIILDHIDLISQSENVNKQITEMRAHLAYYTKGFKNGSHAREIIFNSFDIDLIKNTLHRLFNDITF